MTTKVEKTIQKYYYSSPRIRLYTSEYFEVGDIYVSILCSYIPGWFLYPQTVEISHLESE